MKCSVRSSIAAQWHQYILRQLRRAGGSDKTVRLRNLNLNGAGSGLIGIRITGAAASANGKVVIEDCVIDGNIVGNTGGIHDLRTGGGRLFISNTTVRNIGLTGILINPAGGASVGARIDAVLEGVRIQNANFGLQVGSAARVMVDRSVFSGHSNAGIETSGPLAIAEINVTNSVTSNNGTGIQVGTGANVRI